MEVRVTFDLLRVTPDTLGEGPTWIPAEQRLVWVDIRGRKIRSCNLDSEELVEYRMPSEVGFAVPTRKGLLAGLRDGLHHVSEGGAVTRLTEAKWNTADHRINDGKCDRQGRLWFGTMGDRETTRDSCLYRLEDGEPKEVRGKIITSNGLGWSPDGRTMYSTDSATKVIMRGDYDPDTGDVRGWVPWVEDSANWHPDGLVVDEAGCVWSAKWDGGRLVRYTPEGKVDRHVQLPVMRPTSAVFAGHDLRTLVVTSAQSQTKPEESLAGRTFLLDVGIGGLPEAAATLPTDESFIDHESVRASDGGS